MLHMMPSCRARGGAGFTFYCANPHFILGARPGSFTPPSWRLGAWSDRVAREVMSWKSSSIWCGVIPFPTHPPLSEPEVPCLTPLGAGCYWIRFYDCYDIIGERCLGERCLGERCLGERRVGERCLGERCLGERCVGPFGRAFGSMYGPLVCAPFGRDFGSMRVRPVRSGRSASSDYLSLRLDGWAPVVHDGEPPHSNAWP